MDNNTDLREAPPCRKKRSEKADHRSTLIRAVCLLAACAFVIYGVMRGEAGVVLNKAVNLCLECIGLG